MTRILAILSIDVPDADDRRSAVAILDEATFTVTYENEQGETVTLENTVSGYKMPEAPGGIIDGRL